MLIQLQRNPPGWDLLHMQCVQFGVLFRTRALCTHMKSACNFHQGFYIFICTEMWTFWSPITCRRVVFLVLNTGHDQHPWHSGHIADISHSQDRRGKLSGRRRGSCLGRRPSKQGRHNDERLWEEGVRGGLMPPWGKGRGEGVAPGPLDGDKGQAEVHVSALPPLGTKNGLGSIECSSGSRALPLQMTLACHRRQPYTLPASFLAGSRFLICQAQSPWFLLCAH